jgi:hypothetical protein
MEVASSSFENVAQFKYLGMTVTNTNLIQEEIKRRLNSGNACYHSFHNLLSSCLALKNVEVGICENIILPLVLYGYENFVFDIKGVK